MGFEQVVDIVHYFLEICFLDINWNNLKIYEKTCQQKITNMQYETHALYFIFSRPHGYCTLRISYIYLLTVLYRCTKVRVSDIGTSRC